MKDEALKLALETFESMNQDDSIFKGEFDGEIAVIKEALAKPAQEPVIGTKTWFEDGKMVTQHLTAKDIYKDPEEQEPVAWMHVQGDYEEPSWRQLDDDEIEMGWKQYPLYTTPPQRKPLTQDGTMEIANQTAGQYWMDEAHIQRFRAAVEAAHGIKENT